MMLELIPICYWHEYLDLVFFFKATNGLVHISEDVLPQMVNPTRATRSSSLNSISFRPRKCKTVTYQHSFFVRVTRTRNALPVNLRMKDINLNQFKTLLRAYYLHALQTCYDAEDPRTWKTVCLKCNRTKSLNDEIVCCY